MSIIRPIIRMCTKAALVNKTWADDRVFDSRNTPLADMLTEDAAPYIAIYTDEDTITEIDGKAIYMSPRSVSLTLEIACAKAVAVEGASPAITIPETDEGLELTVDVVQTQMLAALSDPTNQWAELLHKIMFRMIRMPSMRGGSAQAGTRWAARQVVWVCDTVSDCPPGVIPENDHVVQQFITLAKTDPAMNIVADLITNVINQTAAPSWRQAQAWLGLTKEGIRGIGLAPVIEEDETAAQLEEFTQTYVPMAPTVSVVSPVSNPPVFVIGLQTGNGDERDAKVGDIVQILVKGPTHAESINSSALTANEIAAGYIDVTGRPLPDDSYSVKARMQRHPIATTIPSSYSAWSDDVEFIIWTE